MLGNRSRKSVFSTGFTLIELLICIAIIMILAALLMPTMSRVRYRAKLVVCMNNLKQISTSTFMYADDYDGRVFQRREGKPDKNYDGICPPKEREIAKGRSDQDYHHMGSGKIYSHIGEAFAKALDGITKNE